MRGYSNCLTKISILATPLVMCRAQHNVYMYIILFTCQAKNLVLVQLAKVAEKCTWKSYMQNCHLKVAYYIYSLCILGDSL